MTSTDNKIYRAPHHPSDQRPSCLSRLDLVVCNGPCRQLRDWERYSRPMGQYNQSRRVSSEAARPVFVEQSNQDDGDQNFARGMISNDWT